jgi:hypothetical protein
MNMKDNRVIRVIHNLFLHNVLIAKFYPFRKKPILLLSYPRSGSSWLGEILSYSPDIAYLREPITQAIQKKYKLKPQFNPDRNSEILDKYINIADKAFRGVPITGLIYLVKYLPDFLPTSRKNKRLLIKEVNPLAIHILLERYTPTLLLLLRHPAAIADSYKRLGWLKSEMRLFGLNYGTRMKNAIDISREWETKIILFEKIALNPKKEIPDLLNFLGSKLPENIDIIINKYSRNPALITNPYEVRRNSSSEIYKWKDNLSVDEIEMIRDGYLEANLKYYNSESSWLD